jgi:hypothetical protein
MILDKGLDGGIQTQTWGHSTQPSDSSKMRWDITSTNYTEKEDWKT